jgi:hypothetical protein
LRKILEHRSRYPVHALQPYLSFGCFGLRHGNSQNKTTVEERKSFFHAAFVCFLLSSTDCRAAELLKPAIYFED